MNMHRPDPLARRLAALIEENETLHEEVRQLRALLSPDLRTPPEWGLTSGQERLLSTLRAAGTRVVSRKYAIAVICQRHDDLPEPKIIDVHISHIRRKLREAGQPITIETVWTEGYRLTPEGLAALNAAMAAEEARHSHRLTAIETGRVGS